MKIKDAYILKEVANQYVVVPTGKEVINFNGMMTLNRTAKLLFEALQEDKEIDELVNLLVEHFDINMEQAHIDVLDFIKILESKKMFE